MLEVSACVIISMDSSSLILFFSNHIIILLFMNHRHYPNCEYRKNGRCQDRSRNRSTRRWCSEDNDCDYDEICAPSRCTAIFDPCLDYSSNSEGQCMKKPKAGVCPGATDKVCGCDRKTYDNSCLSLEAGSNVKYEGSCSNFNDKEFKKTQKNFMRDYDIDDGKCNEDYFWDYMRDSVFTDGDTCLTVLECKKQSLDFNNKRSFREVSDPYNW